MAYMGDYLALESFTSSASAPAIDLSGQGQNESLPTGNLTSEGFDPALPSLPWQDGGFGTEYPFNDEFNFDFGEFTALACDCSELAPSPCLLIRC